MCPIIDGFVPRRGAELAKKELKILRVLRASARDIIRQGVLVGLPGRVLSAIFVEGHGGSGEIANRAFGVEDAHVKGAGKKAIEVCREISSGSELTRSYIGNRDKGEGEPVADEDAESPGE